MVMVSGYESELYNDLLSGWKKVNYPSKTHTDVRQETIWMNFTPTHNLHDARYLGNTFRERQTIKRRQYRLTEKIERLSPVERQELFKWLNATYGLEQELI
jgi:hypothetical protein